MPISRVQRSGPRGLCVPVPALVRDVLELEPGVTATWSVSVDGRCASLSFHAEVS